MILRYTVPVDDQWHRFDNIGTPVKVGSRRVGEVEFWTGPDVERHTVSDGLGRIISARYEELTRSPHPQWFRVYGTGMDTDGRYIGTTYDGGDHALVWHLFCFESDPDREES